MVWCLLTAIGTVIILIFSLSILPAGRENIRESFCRREALHQQIPGVILTGEFPVREIILTESGQEGFDHPVEYGDLRFQALVLIPEVKGRTGEEQNPLLQFISPGGYKQKGSGSTFSTRPEEPVCIDPRCIPAHHQQTSSASLQFILILPERDDLTDLVSR